MKGKKTETVSKNVTIKVIQAKLPIGDFVEYDVSYTDLTTDGLQPYTFTKDDGWRILDPGIENADGSYSGAKIISTGIPAMLYYHYNKNTGNKNNGWCGTESQVESLYGSTYANNSTNIIPFYWLAEPNGNWTLKRTF